MIHPGFLDSLQFRCYTEQDDATCFSCCCSHTCTHFFSIPFYKKEVGDGEKRHERVAAAAASLSQSVSQEARLNGFKELGMAACCCCLPLLLQQQLEVVVVG
jgi:hypothetical protein